jgi:hypothetical protein
MNKNVKWLKMAVVVLAAATTAYAFGDGPPPAHTGAPGEANCTECHVGTLNPSGGAVRITGVPSQYAPGQEITLTVRTEASSRRRWGFQLTALDSQNRPAGTFALVDDRLTSMQVGTGQFAGRVYVQHSGSGTFRGQTGGADWQVRWTAPPQDVGRITFYAAGNAANNNDQNTGDSIFTTAVSTGTSGPEIIGPAFKKNKFILIAGASNIDQGATLEVSGTHLAATQTYMLVKNGKGTKWQVKATALSTPGSMTPAQVFPAGSTVTLVVKNPNGSASAPATLSR